MRRCQELGRSEDHQRRRGIAELERVHPDEETSEATPEHRSLLETDRAVFARYRLHDVAGRVVDRDRGQQSRDDRDEDRGPHADQRHGQERQERPTIAPRLSIARSNP
jgi:hypothetical protein